MKSIKFFLSLLLASTASASAVNIFNNPRLGIVVHEEFAFGTATATQSLTYSVGGTGAAMTKIGVIGRLGVIQMETGTTITGSALIRGAYAVGGTRYDSMAFDGLGVLTFEGAASLPTLSTASEEYSTYFGFKDTTHSLGIDDGCAFLYQRTTSANMQIQCSSNNTRTTTTTSTAVSTGWHNYKIQIANGLGTAYFFIDNTQIGTITTNIPNLRGTSPFYSIKKAAGTTTSYLLVDFFRVVQMFSGVR